MDSDGDFKVLDELRSGHYCVVIGTRPGIIKMSPIIREMRRRGLSHFVIHAGQHYSDNMSRTIMEDFGLEEPDYHLTEVKEEKLHGAQTAEMLRGIEEVLVEERPEAVLVCGDANFNLAGALAARKLGIRVGHVEAGLRSDDWRMPEEHNRVIIDHISEMLFAPTETARENALEDNVKGEVHVVGNTVVDAARFAAEVKAEGDAESAELHLEDEYCVLTLHREENVDDPETLAELLAAVEAVIERTGWQVVYPIHPRTEKNIDQFGLRDRVSEIEGLDLVPPLRYVQFIQLLSNAQLILTDSGGIQEEACILGVPCVTLRENTERPETVEVGANVVGGCSRESVLEAVEEMRGRDGDWHNPFGDGRTAGRIVDVVTGEA